MQRQRSIYPFAHSSLVGHVMVACVWLALESCPGHALNTGPSRYSFVDLGTLGGPNSVAYGINALGQVVGESDLPNEIDHAFLYSNGVMTDLGTLGGLGSLANDINSAGQIVGQSFIGSSLHAFRYSGGQMSEINFGGTLGINDAGLIVGAEFGVFSKAFRYFNGAVTYLGTLGGGGSQAHDVSNAGHIVGTSGVRRIPNQPRDFPVHAFLYQNGVMTDLGVLNNGPNSVAVAVNDLGIVVGVSEVGDVTTNHAFLYQNGVMTDLGTLGFGFSNATDINNAGQVVGAVSTGDGNPNGFLYHTNGVMYDLNNLIDSMPPGWKFNEAQAINDNGWIAGNARTASGSIHAVLLIPVPEPATALLFILVAAAPHPRRHRIRIRDVQPSSPLAPDSRHPV